MGIQLCAYTHIRQFFLQFTAGKETYQYRGWPNGLCEAPRLFTQLLKPAATLFGRLSIRDIIFLDDILLLHQCRETLHRQVATVVQILTWLGFVINQVKSALKPSQTITYLGMIINTRSMMTSLPETKVLTIQNLCREAIRAQNANKPFPVRTLARIIGTMQAAWPAVTEAPLHYRKLQQILIGVTSYGSWNASTNLDSYAKKDLH